MKRATAVIGACFGDEGKGLMTDYFCRRYKEKTVVVRFNGGAQAGHTVVTPEGLRHIFSHIGSGYFAGADTFLSEHFLVNPTLYLKECLTLKAFPKLIIDPFAPITTIYDMFVNQQIEASRGNGRHGSCGMGVHETMLRQDYTESFEWDGKIKYSVPYRLFAEDMKGADFSTRIVNCRTYSFKRLESLGLLNEEARRFMTDDKVFNKFIEECKEFLRYVVFRSPAQVAEIFDNVVFEGAQGLLLDQNNKQFFPHVTHSSTGLKNVIDLCKKMDISKLDAVYVARSYLTRHGAGPLPHEDALLNFEDSTNNYNPWQGKLRFAYQDWDLIHNAVFSDMIGNEERCVTVTPRMAITHQDQMPRGTTKPAIEMLLEYESFGPTWKDVREINAQAPELSDDAFISYV